MRRRALILACFAALIAVVAITGCSKDETASYDDLVSQGRIESVAREHYDGLFDAIAAITTSAAPDSTLVQAAFKPTDDVVADIIDFPLTLDSRLALDALSYAASDIASSEVFQNLRVREYWRSGLIEPILVNARAYIMADRYNGSSQVQLVRSVQRGAGSRVTDDLLLELIPLVGPAPSDSLMQVCEADSLALRRIHDLVMFTRSLQEIGPPLWMVTGDWLMAVDIEGWPLSFFGLRTWLIDGLLYLTFRDYSVGSVYENVYKDPVPDDVSGRSAWLKRAAAAVDSFMVSDDFAARVKKSDLPLYDAHTFYNDYLIAAQGDSVAQRFDLIIKRQQVAPSAFEYAGTDSIDVIFNRDTILEPGETITRLPATRYRGGSRSRGQYAAPKTGEGYAYVMPIGRHDPEILRKMQQAAMPRIEINAK